MTPDEIHKELEELESRLERLRVKYEQYFTGIEKAVPWVQRKDVDRRFQLMHREQLRSSGLRFRFNTLVQRFTTYQTYWGRILRRIEEGTLKRDVLRAQRLGTAPRKRVAEAGLPEDESAEATRLAGRGPVDEMPEGMFGGDDEEAPREDGFVDFGFSMPPPPVEAPKPAKPVIPLPSVAPPGDAARPRPILSAFAGLRGGAAPPRPSMNPGVKPVIPMPPGVPPPQASVPQASVPQASVPPPRPAPPRPAPPRPEPRGEDDAVRSLYDRYVAARRETGETADVRFETVAKQVRETLPRLAEKYQGADVKLDVTIKDGKAILRPVVTVKKTP